MALMNSAYLLGFMNDFISVLPTTCYVLATFSTHNFLFVDPPADGHERHKLRIEVTHKVSISIGLRALLTMDVRAFSSQKRFTRQPTMINNTAFNLRLNALTINGDFNFDNTPRTRLVTPPAQFSAYTLHLLCWHDNDQHGWDSRTQTHSMLSTDGTT